MPGPPPEHRHLRLLKGNPGRLRLSGMEPPPGPNKFDGVLGS